MNESRKLVATIISSPPQKETDRGIHADRRLNPQTRYADQVQHSRSAPTPSQAEEGADPAGALAVGDRFQAAGLHEQDRILTAKRAITTCRIPEWSSGAATRWACD